MKPRPGRQDRKSGFSQLVPYETLSGEMFQRWYCDAMPKRAAAPPIARGEPLGFIIASVGNAAALAFEAALSESGLHPRHFAVLKGLKGGEAQSQQHLAESLGIPASRLVGLLDELVKRGFVSRRESSTDRRVKLVSLLDAGRSELAKLTELAGRSEEHVTAGLTAADKAELRRLLEIVYSNVSDDSNGARARVW